MRTLLLVAVLVACSTKPEGVVAAADFAKRDPTAWEGKRIKITGKVTGSGGLLLDVEGVSCILAKDAAPDMIGKSVTAEGIVKRTTIGVELADCTATEN